MSIVFEPPALNPDPARIALDGIVGLSDAPRLRSALKGLLARRCKTILVDLSGVADLEWNCWGHLVNAARQVQRHGGAVVLLNCPDHLYSQLVLCGWDRCFLVPDQNSSDRDRANSSLPSLFHSAVPLSEDTLSR